MKVWCHKKSEGVYYELGRGKWNGAPFVVYIAREDHRIWVRNEPEFDDGRFEFLGLTETVFHLTYPLHAEHEADLRPLLINENFEIVEAQAA
jgi:hypothetical protein